MCGIVGGYSSNLVEMLERVQHRGFTACGFVSAHTEQFAERVHDLISVREPGIGHVRYATQDSPRQPFKYKDAWLAFNGEVADGDTERLAHALYHGGTVNGAYSFLWMRHGTIFAGRDPNGFHPLYYAASGGRLVAASETVADISLSWVLLPAGWFINLMTGKIHQTTLTKDLNPSPCCFEDVYFSHVSSRGVWNRRRELGRHIKLPNNGRGIDCIVPVPESAIAAAESLSEASGIPIVSAIMRNRYSERTFIAEDGVSSKYTIIPEAIIGRNIVLVDDSIVRGVTMASLVPELKKYASQVHVRVTFPEIRHACRYGIRIEGAGCTSIPGVDSLEFLDQSLFTGCKACVDGVYLSEDHNLVPLRWGV